MKKMLSGAVAVLAVLHIGGGDAFAATNYAVWYKDSAGTFDRKNVNKWVRYDALDDEGFTTFAQYQAAATRLTQNYQRQGYRVVFEAAYTYAPPGTPAKPPKVITDYYGTFLYKGKLGSVGPYDTYAKADQYGRKYAAAIRATWRGVQSVQRTIP